MKYRLMIHPDMDNSVDSFDIFMFETKAELVASRNTVARILIFIQNKLKIMPNSSNMFISEELINGKWRELYDLDL